MDRFGSLLENINMKKAAYVLFGVLGATLLLFAFFSGGSSNSVDSYPIEGSDQDYSTRARLVNSDDLFKQLSGDRRYDAVSEDLFVFATTGYSVYKTDSPEVIGFVLSGKPKKDGSKVTFSGKYGAVGNKVSVTLTILNNDRIATSITDTKSKLNIDSLLPSNKKINKYISELPKVEKSYSAEYVRSSGNISIFINERSPSLLDAALLDIEKYIDDGSYDRSRIEVLFPTESIGI